jgi:hypothetical protein
MEVREGDGHREVVGDVRARLAQVEDLKPKRQWSLQPYAVEPAALCGGAGNHMPWSLRPYAVEPATSAARLQPTVAGLACRSISM